MTTIITPRVIMHKGFEVRVRHNAYRVYPRNKRKLLWEDVSLSGAEAWIDKLLKGLDDQ